MPANLPGALEESGIWAGNLPALEAYLAVRSQMRVAVMPTGGLVRLGLDYAAAEAGLRLAGIEVTPGTWADLRIIEQAAIAALNGD